MTLKPRRAGIGAEGAVILLLGFVVGMLLVLVLFFAVAKAAVNHPPCDGRRVRQIEPRLGTAAVVYRVEILIRCAERRFPVAGGLRRARCISDRESGDWVWAEGGIYWGLYQVAPTTWASWWRSYPGVRRWIKRSHPQPMPLQARRLDAYSAAMLSLRAMSDSEQPWAGGRYPC